jgi:hypothetical protein
MTFGVVFTIAVTTIGTAIYAGVMAWDGRHDSDQPKQAQTPLPRRNTPRRVHTSHKK